MVKSQSVESLCCSGRVKRKASGIADTILRFVERIEHFNNLEYLCLIWITSQQTITLASFVLCISLASAQLSYHLDANTNSYTLKTPNSQQTITRHFSGQHGAAAHQGSHQINAAPFQQQQQQQQVNEFRFIFIFIFFWVDKYGWMYWIEG